MNEMKVFCEECRNDVIYEVHDCAMSGTIRGQKYEYIGKEAHCVNCNSLVYVAEINDFNLRTLYDVYREKTGIISLEMIRAIPDRYAIGKRPLSLLLGWGEQTFSRYFDGDIPTQQYSDILQKIYYDPQYYAELLEKNAGNLKTPHTYEKSKRAVNLLLELNNKKGSKIDLVINYLLNQCEDITPLALQKALYYIQGFYYAFYATFLFEADCEAWIHGPVYRNVYSQYKDYRFDPIERKEEIDYSVFSSAEKSIMDSIINHICCYSGKVLESFTHNETPWIEARGTLPTNVSTNRTISKESIGIFFVAIKQKYNMLSPNDIRAYTQDMFKCI